MILDEVKAHSSGLAVWWTGHNGWLIKSDRLLVGTDLATEDEARLYRSPITAEELAPLLDIAFITHRHGDHSLRLSRPLQARYHILKQGQKLEIERAPGDGGRRKDGDHPARRE